MERRFVTTRLGQVHCVIAGAGSLTPVVLLHQTPRSIDEFAEVLPIIALHRRTVAIDAPGYGCSDRLERQPTVEAYATTVAEVMDGLGVERAHVVGHHTGSIVAVELAAAAPDRVASLALSPPVYVDEAMRHKLARFFGQWRVQSDGSHLMEKWQKFAAWTADPTLVERVLVDLLAAGETSEFGHFAAGAYRMEERLPLVRAAALLIVGSSDPFVFPECIARFTSTLLETRVIEIEGGVFLPNEAPEAFAGAVLNFIDGQQGPDGNR